MVYALLQIILYFIWFLIGHEWGYRKAIRDSHENIKENWPEAYKIIEKDS